MQEFDSVENEDSVRKWSEEILTFIFQEFYTVNVKDKTIYQYIDTD